MDIIQLVDNLSEDMYQRFKSAVETGKWPEGTPVDEEQRHTAMQIVMAYQSRRLASEDIMTIGQDGEIVTKSKSELKAQFKQASSDSLLDDSNPNDIARFTDL